uniref:(California timema) hypothetical protein n=1 Tax=Timema californicum TaxID=61474 RepID=A0A7R9JFB7_TIMCA|nr:unnamed protein product [Timema californicum]
MTCGSGNNHLNCTIFTWTGKTFPVNLLPILPCFVYFPIQATLF